MTTICSTCGAPLDAGARFCRSCGRPATAVVAAASAARRRPPLGRIALGLVLVVVVAVVGIALLATSGPADAATKHLQELARRNDAAAYALTSPAFRNATSAADFTAFVEGNAILRSGSFTVTDTTVSGESATVTVDLKSGADTRTADFQMVKVEGDWLVSGFRLRAVAAAATAAPATGAPATGAPAQAATARPAATATPSGQRSMIVDDTLAIPKPVSMLALNTTTQRVFGAGDASLVIISGRDQRVDTTSGAPAGLTPVSIAVNSATNTIYYAYRTGTTWLIDMKGDRTGYVQPATAESQALKIAAVAVDSKTDRLFELFDRQLTIQKGDLTTRASATLGVGGVGIVVNDKNGEAYVIQSGGQIVVIGADGQVGRSFPAGLPVTHGAVDTATGLLYALEPGTRSVVVIDTASGSMDGVITVPATPTDIEISPAKGRIYVSTVDGVVTIDAKTRTVYSRTALPGRPAGLAVDPSSGIVYVAQAAANTVTLLRD